MHEFAVCQKLLQEAERIARGRGARAISGLVVVIGPLSGVEPTLLESSFVVARSATSARNATLEIQQLPVVICCNRCKTESEVPPNSLICRSCGNWRVTLKSGDELILKRVDLSIAETMA
jgi:hydrogenase nickel incorporation protein HypA/HybF